MPGEYQANGKWYSANRKPAPIGFVPPTTPAVNGTVKPTTAGTAPPGGMSASTAGVAPPTVKPWEQKLNMVSTDRNLGQTAISDAEGKAAGYLSANNMEKYGAAQRWISQLKGAMGPDPNATATPDTQTPTQTPPDYQSLAASRFAASLANKQTIANQQKTAADTAYNQQTLRTKDDRILADSTRRETVNPFSGRTSYQEGLIGRERTQADADSAAALQSQKANIDELLASYENASADEQVRIADELQRADRQYQIDLAGVTGTFNGQKTATQANSDRSFDQSQQVVDYNQSPTNPNNVGQVLQNKGQEQQNVLNQFKIDDYPAEQKANATKVQQELAAGKIDLEAAKYNLEELKNPQSSTNLAKKYEAEIKRLELAGLPETQRLELQKLQKTIAQIGVVHYKPQTAAERDYDTQKVVKIKAEIDKIKNGSGDTPTTITAESYQKNIKPRYEDGELVNGQQIEDQIILSGMSDYEQYRAYIANGLKWDDPIPTK